MSTPAPLLATLAGNPELVAEAAARLRAEDALRARNRDMESELELAGAVQRAVLPATLPVSYVDLAVHYARCGAVSGDVYDFTLNREGELGVFVGDATGHGVSAALLTMMVFVGLDSLPGNLSTDEVLRRLNRLMASRQTGLSVTGVFLRISAQGQLRASHAGHPPTAVIPASGSPVRMFVEGACPLGSFADEPVTYVEEQVQLAPGDKVLAYTDAVIEQRNAEGTLFGTEGLTAALDSLREHDAGGLLDGVLESISKHADGTACRDDLTMIAMEYRGTP